MNMFIASDSFPKVFCCCKGIKGTTFQLVQNFSYQQLVQLVQMKFQRPKKGAFKPWSFQTSNLRSHKLPLDWFECSPEKKKKTYTWNSSWKSTRIFSVRLGTNCQLGKSHLFHHGLRSALRHDSACLLSEEEHGKLPMDNKQLHSHRDSVCMLWKCMKMSGLQVLLPSFW